MIEQIGNGGNGTLYLARDMELGSIWAVKVIPLEQKREAKILRSLSHDALPCMVDYLEEGENCYLVMEYIQGNSLGNLLREGKQFSFEEVVEIGKSAAKVLEYLHTRKPEIYYCDLKPDNLMLSESGKIYLVDLGSAVVGFRNQQKKSYGTKGFAAPEQYDGYVGVTSDIYTFGKTMMTLCGKKKWVHYLKYPSFFYLLLRCCRKDASKRWKSMKDVQKQLEGIWSLSDCFRFSSVLFMAIVMSVIFLMFAVNEWIKTVPFEVAMTSAMDSYYLLEGDEGNCFENRVSRNGEASAMNQENIINGEDKGVKFVCAVEEQKKVYAIVEKKLQKMLKKYTSDDEQKRILLCLAINAELQQEWEKTEIYYEQLLLYEENLLEAYVEYGLFLCRQGKYEKSEKVWKQYLEKEKNGIVTGEKYLNLEVWETKLKENME